MVLLRPLFFWHCIGISLNEPTDAREPPNERGLSSSSDFRAVFCKLAFPTPPPVFGVEWLVHGAGLPFTEQTEVPL
jgi:hypothetical protein